MTSTPPAENREPELDGQPIEEVRRSEPVQSGPPSRKELKARHREAQERSIGSGVSGILLAGLAAFPALAGGMALLRDGSRVWFIVGLVVAVCMLLSTIIVSGRMRERNQLFRVCYLISVLVNVVVLVGLLVTVRSQELTWSGLAPLSALLVAAPVLGALVYGVGQAIATRRADKAARSLT
ncbi:hypothetical protein ACTQ49_12030 [Luteococcus sp. Sow4_B9]|uniref:hypothetical protein n=1 Tax=Luteococcus sp. Sow4_B9 TaxID=3438792 RepID=UPI003F9E37A2